MCDSCGCNITPGNKHLVQTDGKLAVTESGKEAVTVLKSLLSENDHQAGHNRKHFDQHGVLAINLMSSPGSGKTALLEATIEALKDSGLSIAVVEGDLETENDAERIRAHGVPAIQITTGSACHLDAHMVHDALHQLDLNSVDILFIENVGNLVCPASFDLGHHHNITLLSTTEGDDKPAKYPVIFRAADLMLITKSDLLTVLDDFSPEKAERHLRELASSVPTFSLSAKSGEGIEQWIDWLREAVNKHKTLIRSHQTIRPAIQQDGIKLHRPHNHPHSHGHIHPHTHEHN
ncbi:MAG: hydrogenase nickel incorporation protein HypB [Gammaproteobacteria bacterium]|nr:hydrogenase nickel incorporation protein HypB [Gammaproteobacteria bacterium]